MDQFLRHKRYYFLLIFPDYLMRYKKVGCYKNFSADCPRLLHKIKNFFKKIRNNVLSEKFYINCILLHGRKAY